MIKTILFLKSRSLVFAVLALLVLILEFASVPVLDDAIAGETLISQGSVSFPQTEAAFTLQILHASDFEASADAIEDAPGFSAVVNALRQTVPNTIILSSGDNYLPSPFYRASADPSFAGRYKRTPGKADIEILNAIGIQASALGNHEFDEGPKQLGELIKADGAYPGTQFPYISTNVQFDAQSPLSQDEIKILAEPGLNAAQLPNRVVASAILNVNGESIGLVGATTAQLARLSQEQPGTQVLGGITADDDAVAASAIQPYVDDLATQGINKIVLLAHLQQLNNEVELATQLRGVDVIVAGGSHDILSAADWPLREDELKQRSGDYPLLRQSASGEPVAIVNTDANYRYVGRLVVDFDKQGKLVAIAPSSGPYPTDNRGVQAVGGVPDPNIMSIVEKIDEIIETKDANILGAATVFLNGERFEVRNQETNLGNLTAEANLDYAQSLDSDVVISLKNGGGIRASIGSFSGVGGAEPSAGKRQATAPDPLANKPEDKISQLDIETALPFNNGLTLLSLTPSQLKEVLEHSVSGVAPGETPGAFPQIAGFAFSFDPKLAPGERIRTVVVSPEQEPEVVIRDGIIVGDNRKTFRMVTLTYLANGEDGFPFKNFEPESQRRDLGELAAQPLPGYQQRGTEQFALAQYLSKVNPYTQIDTPPEEDHRIQNIRFRNDGRTNSDVTEADRTYARLVEAIVEAGGVNYRAIDVAPLDDTNGGQPGGNIRVGFLFNPGRVSLAPGMPGNATTAVQVTDTAIPALTLNPGSIDPNNPAFNDSRKPLAAEFNFNGESVFVIANHFASKGGGREADLQRVRQAQAVHNFAAEILEDDADAKVIVAGDLNDFADSPALKVVAGNELQNLIQLLPRSDRFTFEFRGNLQVLDHILVSQSLLFDADAEFDIVHANIRQSNAASDHDPVLARFTLAQAGPVVPLPTITPVPPVSSTILPGLTGEALERQLATDFAVTNSLDYGRARDFMYGQIDNDNGTVLTLYANFPARIPADVNAARTAAGAVRVNAEHSWPQSKGTGQGRARSDLHHLFPTLERLNSIRGNKPFANIPDAQTDVWFFEARELEFPPPRDIIDNFTESDLPAWEPREAIKGDLARAQFYVASIYRNQVERNFFEGQRQTLCQWHAADPVDTKEMTRNASIKALQGNDNPFILDPSLAARLYCN